VQSERKGYLGGNKANTIEWWQHPPSFCFLSCWMQFGLGSKQNYIIESDNTIVLCYYL